MYILFESSDGSKTIDKANIFYLDVMGTVSSEEEALNWCDENSEYRAYKYVRV